MVVGKGETPDVGAGTLGQHAEQQISAVAGPIGGVLRKRALQKYFRFTNSGRRFGVNIVVSVRVAEVGDARAVGRPDGRTFVNRSVGELIGFAIWFQNPEVGVDTIGPDFADHRAGTVGGN